MTSLMIKNAYASMGPLPGAEERIWLALDDRLRGKARNIRVCMGRRMSRRPLRLAAAAAILVLALLALFAVLRSPDAGAKPRILPAATPVPEEQTESAYRPRVRDLQLVNALVEGKSVLRLDEEGEFLARALVPEGMAVDHWLRNGQAVESGGRLYSLFFSSEGVERLEAVLREQKAVRCGDNACVRFLDEAGQPAGTAYRYLSFEHAYTAPVTGQTHPGGSISAYVSPVIPYGWELDYWVIDGQPLQAGVNPRGILLQELDRGVEIDAVLRKSDEAAALNRELVLQGSGAAELAAPPADDLPAGLSARPENSPWLESEHRDGLPFDPDAPAADGHLHDWVETGEGILAAECCQKESLEVYQCSVCGIRYWKHYVFGHRFKVYPAGSYSHYEACSVCGYCPGGSRAHTWVWRSGNHVRYCPECGYVDPYWWP